MKENNLEKLINKIKFVFNVLKAFMMFPVILFQVWVNSKKTSGVTLDEEIFE